MKLGKSIQWKPSYSSPSHVGHNRISLTVCAQLRVDVETRSLERGHWEAFLKKVWLVDLANRKVRRECPR